jgi:hypothetical protein
LVADNEDLDRTGFEEMMMRLIIQRRIKRLVISDREQVCSAGAWPLFEWLCKQHDVMITLEPLRSVDTVPETPQTVGAGDHDDSAQITHGK